MDQVEIKPIFHHSFCESQEVDLNLSLQERWALEINEPKHFDHQLKEILQDKEILFVPGFLNELVGRPQGLGRSQPIISSVKSLHFSVYFQLMQKVLSEEAGKKSNFLETMSHRNIAENAKKIYDHLIKRNKNSKVILIGHSKGGAEVLYAFLKYPVLYEIIDRVVLIQAAIGGNSLILDYKKVAAEYGYIQPSPRKWAKYSRWFASLLLKDAVESLQSNNATHLFSEFTEKLSDPIEREKLKRKIFYVTSSWEVPSKKKSTSAGVSFVLLGCSNDFKDGVLHDGLLRVEDQVYRVAGEIIGTDLGLLQADHMSLVISGWASSDIHLFDWMTRAQLRKKELKEQEKKQAAFARALFYKIFEKELMS